MGRVRLAVVGLSGVISLAATAGLLVHELDAEAASRAWVASLVASLLAADVRLPSVGGGGGGGGAAVLLAALARGALVLGASETAGAMVGALLGGH